jgi:hypothetical protein
MTNFTPEDLRFLKAVGIDVAGLRVDIIESPTAGECGEPSYTTPEGIPIDGTVQWLMRAGVPVTAENWLNLQWMGNPPKPPYDGEFLADLPDWVRQALDALEQEGIEEMPEQFRTEANEDNEEEN